MKKGYLCCLISCLIIFIESNVYAQVTNLTVNGYTSDFSFTQGDSLKWEYNLPDGGTAQCEIWIDLNGNGIIDPTIDKQLFGTFTQTDGIYNGGNGPGDMDSVANGQCYFAMANFGLAPAKYVLRFTNNGVGQSITGTVTAMASPAFTVSGKVTPPPGINAQNILVESGGNSGQGWMALTDVGGNYIINFNASVSGQQVTIEVADQFPPYVFVPTDTTLTLSKSYTGVNFTVAPPAAQLVGYLKGEDGRALANVTINSNPQYYGYGGGNKNATTDANGFFQFGYTLSEITSSPIWSLQANSDGVAPAYFPPNINAISLHQHDSLRVDLIAHIADDSITGKVTVDGHAPGGTSFKLYTYAQDSGQTNANSDPNTGNFTLHVTKKFSNYQLGIDDLPQNYGYDQNIPQVQPGDKNVIINVGTLAWLPQTSNTSNSLKSVSFVNSTTGWVVGSNGTMLKTVNAGASWSSQTTNTSNNINGICFLDASTGWLVGDGGVIKKTTNGGGSWASQNSTTASDLKAVQFFDANTGWAVGGSGQAIILKTINGGTTWTSQNPGNGEFYSLAMVNASIGWVVGDGGIHATTDGGGTWNSQFNSFSTLYSVHFANANTGWAVGLSNNVYMTTDGGNNWTTQSIANVNNLNSVYCINASTAWVAGSNGNIYRTTNGGSTWTIQLTNTNNSNLSAVQFVDAVNGWAVGDNGTILHTASGGVVSVGTKKSAVLPDRFELLQNYPNPFNPATTISFALASNGFTTLKIYDIVGREVSTLRSEEMRAGIYSVQWNASTFASGVYFYQLRSGSYTMTKKLVLLK